MKKVWSVPVMSELDIKTGSTKHSSELGTYAGPSN